MPIPSTVDICQLHLFSSREEMCKERVPVLIQERLIRLRDLYNYWLDNPLTKDADIARTIQARYELSRSAAYDDLRILKQLIGNLAKTTKDYHRWRLCTMIEETYQVAKEQGDAKAMAAALDKYGKYHQLDKEDLLDHGFDKIVVQPFAPTDDPSVLGFKPIENFREKRDKKIKQYWNDSISDVKFEEIEFDEDSVFNPKPLEPHAETVPK